MHDLTKSPVCFALLVSLLLPVLITTRLHKRSASEEYVVDEENMQVSSSESMQISSATRAQMRTTEEEKERRHRFKHAEVYKPIINTPDSAQIQYARVAKSMTHLDEHMLPLQKSEHCETLDISEACESKEYSAMTSSGQEGGIQKMSSYDRLKIKAEQEGRLEEFKQVYRDRAARRREKLKEEGIANMGKYQYACRKMRLEAIRAEDPYEALRLEDVRKAKDRESSKKYYYAHREQVRLRRMKNKTKVADQDVEEQRRNEQDEVGQICHDFDLNDPAACEDIDEGGYVL